MAFTHAGRYGPEAVLDSNGELLKSTPFHVYEVGTSTHATLYTDRFKTLTVTQPISTDLLGDLMFFAEPGEYDIAAVIGVVIQPSLTVPVEPFPGDITAEDVWTFTVTGPVGAQAGFTRMYVERASSIVSIRASVDSPSVGQDIIVDVNKNQMTVFPIQANRPTIAAGTNTILATPGILDLDVGDFITVDIDQAGTTAAGSDLTVNIRVTKP